MKITYDPEADAFYARFAPDQAAVASTVEAAPNVMLDLDAKGELVGIEVLGVASWLKVHDAAEAVRNRKHAAE